MSTNRDASDAMTAASSGPSWTADNSDPLPRSISEKAQNSSDDEMEMAFGNTASQKNMSQKSLVGCNTAGMKSGDDDSESDGNEVSLHSRADSVPAASAYPSDSLLDKQAKALSKELDDIFDSFDDFGPRGDEEDSESNVFTQLANQTKDPGKERGPDQSALDQGARITEEMSTKSSAAAVTISASIQDNNAKSSTDERSTVDETTSLKPATPPIMPTVRRNSSVSRRRHRHIHQMERISETGNDISNSNSEETKDKHEFEEVNQFEEDFFVQGNVSEHTPLNNNIGNSGDDDVNPQRSESYESSGIAATTATLPSISAPRRRIRSLGGSPGSIGGNSMGSGRSTTGSGTRLRRGRRRHARISRSVDGERRDTDNDDDAERIRRMGSGGNTLVASLDAGMATLRRWIRTRRLSFSSGTSGAGGAGGSSSGHSVSSMTTFRLGEEDIFALSHTGSDPRRVAAAGASSTSSDPNMTVFDPNSSNGFLYYRPYEVHVHNDVDADSGFYGSDDESGTSSSILLHPLVPSTESSSHDGSGGQQQSRQRAYSEPDRARIVDFFSSVYGSRAIDGGRTRGETVAAGRDRERWRIQQPLHRSSSMRPVVSTSPMIIEEETDATEQDNGLIGEQPLTAIDVTSTRLQSLSQLDGGRDSRVSALEAPDATVPPLSPLSGNATEAGPLGALESATTSNNDPTAIDANDSPNRSTPSTSDPNFRARTRWMRINRRFRCIITSVAVLFSLLLFFIVIAWVLLISTYVLSHNKECDVPLKAYFWMVSLQLLLDIFRADIMKWLCRYRTDSGRRIPPRVIMYNVAYLIYAMLVLRLGVRSVFITDSTCSSTAPELFYASLVFVCLSLMAWAIILLGYLIPFCFVAILLTRNGYFPDGGIASSRGVMGGRRAHIGTGRISGIVGEVFPNTCSNPAPPGCVDKLRVVLLHEFPDSYQKECCICMMEYKEGEVIVATPCEHVFHKRCCQEWLQLSRTCPVCRKDLPDALGMNEGDVQGSSRGSFISESEEEMRGQNNGSTENSTVMRESRQEVSNLVRFLRRGDRRQSAGDATSTTNNHPEGIVVIEFPETANDHMQQHLDA